jgi:hypothetical protein
MFGGERQRCQWPGCSHRAKEPSIYCRRHGDERFAEIQAGAWDQASRQQAWIQSGASQVWTNALVWLEVRDSWRREQAGGDLSSEAREELEQRLGLYEAAFEVAEQIKGLTSDEVQTVLLLGQRLDGMLEGLKRARNESPAAGEAR